MDEPADLVAHGDVDRLVERQLGRAHAEVRDALVEPARPRGLRGEADDRPRVDGVDPSGAGTRREEPQQAGAGAEIEHRPFAGRNELAERALVRFELDRVR